MTDEITRPDIPSRMGEPQSPAEHLYALEEHPERYTLLVAQHGIAKAAHMLATWRNQISDRPIPPVPNRSDLKVAARTLHRRGAIASVPSGRALVSLARASGLKVLD